MSLNDPFGRVSRRQQQAYETLREQLRTQDVSTTAAVRQTIDNLMRTSTRLLLAVLAAVLIASLLLPSLRAAIVVLGGLLLIWLLSSFMQTRAHLNRYLHELTKIEAKQQPPNDNTRDTEEENLK